MYLEVPIGGPGGDGDWPAGCTVRRLDAVRILSSSEPDIAVRLSSARDAFVKDLARFPAELLEVKRSLNRTAIGQVVAGRRMFERQYGARPTVAVVCAASDSALEWVCSEEAIAVHVVPVSSPSDPELDLTLR